MKRTNVVIDEKKLEQAKKVFDIYTTKDLIDFVITEMLKMESRKRILTMKGRLELDLTLDEIRQVRK